MKMYKLLQKVACSVEKLATSVQSSFLRNFGFIVIDVVDLNS